MNTMLRGTRVLHISTYSHIRQYHENVIASTLEESQSMFDNSSSSRIWSMMDKEFEAAKSSILEHERTKNVLHPSTSSSSTSIPSISSSEPSCFHSYSGNSTHSFQYFSLHFFSPDSHPNDDVSKAPLFESAMTSIFQSICSKKTPDIAGILLSALESSHQDVSEFQLCKK